MGIKIEITKRRFSWLTKWAIVMPALLVKSEWLLGIGITLMYRFESKGA